MRLTRFLRNPAVTLAEIVDTASARTAARCEGRHVLAIQDTTVIRSQGGGGLYLHPVLAVDADDNAILGLIHASYLSRSSGKSAARRTKIVEDKESRRWLDGAQAAGKICAGAARVTVIADRESDIFAAFAECPAGVDMLVRAAQDRCLEDGGKLFDRIDALPAAGCVALDLPAKPGRKAREAHVEIRFAAVELRCPRNGIKAGLPDTVGLHVVDVREVNPPAGEVVHWRLLTTHRVEDVAQALAIVELYRRRWAIEQLFRTMKSHGFDIEGVLIEDEAPLQRLAMATLVAAVIVQQLVHARDGLQGPRPLRPLLDAFDADDTRLLEAFSTKLEGKTIRQKNPHPKGSLAFAAWVCARLGGWTGYYGKPGPLVMLNGWIEFQSAKRGVALFAGAENV